MLLKLAQFTGIASVLITVFAEANYIVHEGKLKKGCFVRLKSYQANFVKGKRYNYARSTSAFELIEI